VQHADYRHRSVLAFRPSTISKVFLLIFQYFRSISTSLSTVDNRSMEQSTIDKLETAREIDDLNDTIHSQRLTITFQEQQLRSLRVRLNRYEAILGMEEAA